MKIFIWEYVDDLTWNYHSGGGVVAIAENEARAREMVSKKHTSIPENQEPDFVSVIESDTERLSIFPDAGCCG